MKSQPNRNYRSNDRVMTPLWLATALVKRVQPSGRILEPCAGRGAFVQALSGYGQINWCEIDEGRDFFAWRERVDWVITNPPWSQFRRFLEHSLRVADHVALLATVNHWWTRQRCAMLHRSDFGFRQLILFDSPAEFQPTGFQLGVMVVTRGYHGRLGVEWMPSRIEQLSITTEDSK